MASPYSNSSSPGHPSPNVPKHVPINTPLKKYVLKPPPRLMPLSKTTHQLGYPGLFLQRSEQEEDIMTESNMRNGFIDRPVVSNEHTCGHDIVYGKLQDDQRLMNELGNFMVEVLKRKRKSAKMTGTSSFKPPLRSTLVDAKKEQWMQELAGGIVPLRKLARNVPHGFKGEKLLDTLAAKQVPFLRASWYIKIVGLSEMTQRNANNTNASISQANHWTIVVIGHLKKQLGELSAISTTPHHPNTNTRGHKIHHNPPTNDAATKPWATPENRARFEQRWTYSTRLARWQYCEGLLDQRAFLRSSLDVLQASTSFETMWLILTGLVQDYVDEYRRNRTLMKLLIEILVKTYSALLSHTDQLQDDKSYWIFCALQKEIRQMLQSLFLSTPDVFVIPKFYYQYKDIFNRVFGEDISESAFDAIPNICNTMKKYWTIVKARNEVFCGTAEENKTKEENTLYQSKTQDSDNSLNETRTGEHVVHVLDSIGKHVGSQSGLLIDGTSWISIQGQTAKSAVNDIFGQHAIERQPLAHIITTMCQWVITDSRYANTPIILLFSVLIKFQLFSYQKYLLRLIARGELESSQRHKYSIQKSLHYLASFPLLAPTPAYLIHQRKVAIYGVRNEDGDLLEKETLSRLKRMARYAIVGEEIEEDSLFGSGTHGIDAMETNESVAFFDTISLSGTLLELSKTMQTSSRYIVQLFCDWLVEEVLHYVVENVQIGEDNWRVMTSPGSCMLNSRQYMTTIKILESAKDYTNIIKISLWMLKKTNKCSLYLYIVDSLRRHSNIWKLTDASHQVAEAMWEKHQELKSKRISERCIMMYIVQLVQEGYRISNERRTQLQYDLQVKPILLNGLQNNTLPLVAELNQIIQNPSSSNIQTISESLCARYGTTAGWVGFIIQGIVEVLASLCIDQHTESSIRDTSANEEILERTREATVYSSTFYQAIYALVNLLERISNLTTITGDLEEVIVYWLSKQCSPVITNRNAFINEMNQKHSWAPLFLSLLVARGCVGLDVVFRVFVIPWFEHFAQETQLAADNVIAESIIMQFGINLVSLVRFLIVGEQCQTALKDNTYTSRTLTLRVEEEFRLEKMRETYLISGLDKLESLFIFIEHLLTIFANLPLSSTLLRELAMLKTDLLQLVWFRQACIRDLEGVYQRFSTQEVADVNKRKTKKEMLYIIDELIGTSPNFEHQDMAHDKTPSFIDKLNHVFMSLSQWNEDLCRVQLNLLLDNILLSEGLSSDTEDTEMLGGNNTSSDMDICKKPDIIGLSFSKNKELIMFVNYAFNMALSEDEDEKVQQNQRRFAFLKSILNGIREPFLMELLTHGVFLLEGSEGSPFPENVLLTTTSGFSSQTFDSERFTQRSHTFLNIMQHMVAEDTWTTDKKIDFLKALYRQIKRYKDALNVYIVMEGAQVSYNNAVQALHLLKNNVDTAIALIMTEGITEISTEGKEEVSVMLQDIRTSLLIRLKLIVPFAALIWEHPKEDGCDILEWIKVLVSLLGNPLVHGNGSQEKFFEFVLDLVSLLIDDKYIDLYIIIELPRELRKPNIVYLSSIDSELASLPSTFLSRVKRILPFLIHNIYINSTRIASSLIGAQSTNLTPQQQQQHLEACMEHSKPWSWLEDHVSDPPVDNDTSINIALFDARKFKKVEGTYAKWFKSGFSDKPPGENEIGESPRVSSIGHSRKKPVESSDENNFIFIIDEEEEVAASSSKRRLVDMEEGELP
ncbi:hypothetical protein BDF14DRAFT_1730934 [Spinellus fusiger]|nr:hypothetical protein BDF14DRAFT_1730934 [Spinellus fusiger]